MLACYICNVSLSMPLSVSYVCKALALFMTAAHEHSLTSGEVHTLQEPSLVSQHAFPMTASCHLEL